MKEKVKEGGQNDLVDREQILTEKVRELQTKVDNIGQGELERRSEEIIYRKIQEEVDGRMEWEKEQERRKLNVVIMNMRESEEREIEKRIKHDMEICIELFRMDQV